MEREGERRERQKERMERERERHLGLCVRDAALLLEGGGDGDQPLGDLLLLYGRKKNVLLS